MKEEQIQREDGKASKASNIKMSVIYLDPKYTISAPTVMEIRPRGPLVLFEINPSGEGPSFKARWDGGSRDEGKEEKCELDIDYLKQISMPFELLPGGYQTIFLDGLFTNVFGSRAKEHRFAREDRRGHRSEQRKLAKTR